MFNLILILGLLSTACGVFVVGFGIPIRETTFGSALLVAGAVAIAGGFVTIGLAAVVSELRRVIAALKARLAAVPRPLRPVESKGGPERRPGPPQMRIPGRPSAETAVPDSSVPPTQRMPAPPQAQSIQSVPPAQPMPSFPEAARTQAAYPVTARPGPSRPGPAPSVMEHPDAVLPVAPPSVPPPGMPHPSSPEWLRRAFAEISTAQPAPGGSSDGDADDPRSTNDWPRTSPPPATKFIAPSEAEPLDSRQRGAVGETSMFDAVWPSGRRRPAEVPIPERRDEERREPQEAKRPAEPAPRLPEPRPNATATAPPAAFPPPTPPRPQSILKSGVIDEMAYTLFTDGSIEAQMPDGTMRFASIEELRRHLETQGG